MNYDKWYKNFTGSLSDKNIVITGATGGLGKETCFHLLYLNANIVMACRNMEKSNNLKEQLLKSFPNAKIDIIKLDISNLISIDNFCDELTKKYPNGIDYFINNAGVYQIDKRESAETKLDILFQTNFFGPIYLTKKLLPYLNKHSSKIIFVDSISYKFQKIDITDCDYKNCKKKIKRYGNTKRWLLYGILNIKNEIDIKYKNIDISIVHPGVCATNIFNKPNGKALNIFYKTVLPIMKVIFNSPKKASLNLVSGIFTNTYATEWIGPRGLFQVWGKPKRIAIKDLIPKEQEFVDCFIKDNVDCLIK